MKKKKLYFSDFDEEFANTIPVIIEEMKERGLSEINVSEAIRELGTDYFFCKAVGEVGMRGEAYEPCGKECKLYEPRNGKSGCCKHRGFCYVPSDVGLTLKINGDIL